MESRHGTTYVGEDVATVVTSVTNIIRGGQLEPPVVLVHYTGAGDFVFYIFFTILNALLMTRTLRKPSERFSRPLG